MIADDQLLAYRNQFNQAAKKCLAESGRDDSLYEAAFPAYTDPNPLIRFLMWQRIKLVLAEFDRIHPRDRVLDFGCGSGIMLRLLAGEAKRVVGVDKDLGPATKMNELLELPENVELINNSRQSLASLPDASFDCVFAMEVLEHVSDLPGIVGELRRLTRPGGTILVSGPTENLFYRIGRLIAGSKYTGEYHASNIDLIRDEFARQLPIRSVATLYPLVPLVKIFVAEIP